MANPIRGETDFVVGEQTYRLRYDANAICEAEGALGKSIVAISQDLADGNVSMTIVRALLWAGLRRKQPHITLMETGDLIEASGGLFKVYEKVAAAFALAFPANPPMESSQANGGIGLDS